MGLSPPPDPRPCIANWVPEEARTEPLPHSPGGSVAVYNRTGKQIARFDRPEPGEVGGQSRYGNSVWCMAFAPDNKHLLTCSRDKTAKVWDLATKESVLTFPDHQNSVNGVTVVRGHASR